MANTSILAAFERMWQHVINVVSGKADVDHTHNTATQSTSGFLSAEDKTQLDNGGIPIVTASSSNGVTYTATVDGVSTLTNGMKITIIPNANSTNVNTKLNVNGLGDKYIRMPIAYNSTASSAGALASWIGKNKPITLEYDGTYWKTISMPRPSALYLYGTVPVASGGTGATTVEEAKANFGIGTVLFDGEMLHGDIDTWTESYTLTGDITKYSLVVVTSTFGACVCSVNNRVDDFIIDIMGVGHNNSDTNYRVFIRLGDGMLVEQKTERVSGSVTFGGNVYKIIGLI